MKAPIAFLTLAACLFVSCEKRETKSKPDIGSSENPQIRQRADTPSIAQNLAPAQRESPAANTGKPIDPPISHPVDPSKIRPAGIKPDDASWDALTGEQKIGAFKSNGIARIPGYISEQILADASSAGTPEDQLQFLIQQSAAWHHINHFKENATDIPDHMKMALLEKLSVKYGESWKDMVPELNEQLAASAQVMKLRLNGIPGMSPDESSDFLIHAIEKYGSDYKAILSVANQHSRK